MARAVRGSRSLAASLFVLVLGSCTAMLWSDDRTRERRVLSTDLRAFRVPGVPRAIALQLPPALARVAHGADHRIAPDDEWLLVRLPGSDANEREWNPAPESEVWLLNDDGRVRWVIGSWPPPPRSSPPKYCDGLPRTQPCVVGPLAMPRELGDPLPPVTFATVDVLDDGTTVAVRVAATPVAVAGDLVFATAFVVVGIALAPIGVVASLFQPG